MKKIFMFMIITMEILYPEPTTQEILDSCNKTNYAYGCETIANMYNYGGEFKRNKKKLFSITRNPVSLVCLQLVFKQGKFKKIKHAIVGR